MSSHNDVVYWRCNFICTVPYVRYHIIDMTNFSDNLLYEDTSKQILVVDPVDIDINSHMFFEPYRTLWCHRSCSNQSSPQLYGGASQIVPINTELESWVAQTHKLSTFASQIQAYLDSLHLTIHITEWLQNETPELGEAHVPHQVQHFYTTNQNRQWARALIQISTICIYKSSYLLLIVETHKTGTSPPADRFAQHLLFHPVHFCLQSY